MPLNRERAISASNPLLAAGIGILMACVLGCGGGGGGDDSDPVLCTSLTFDRVLASPSNGDVYLEQASSNCTSIEVGVLVSNLSGIWSVGFDLTFPTTVLQFDSYTLGPLLQKGSPQYPVFHDVKESSGVVQVTMTRFGTDPAVTAVGSEALITLRFTRVGSGAAAIDFNTSSGSTVGESILDDNGVTRPAIFAPGHGGMAIVP